MWERGESMAYESTFDWGALQALLNQAWAELTRADVAACLIPLAVGAILFGVASILLGGRRR